MAIFRLVIYVPTTHAKEVKSAIFAAGAGQIGNYDCCCWQAEGTGQFRPMEGNSAFIGETGKLEKVAETKIETIFAGEVKKEVISALREAHPYETPAFQYWEVFID